MAVTVKVLLVCVYRSECEGDMKSILKHKVRIWYWCREEEVRELKGQIWGTMTVLRTFSKWQTNKQFWYLGMMGFVTESKLTIFLKLPETLLAHQLLMWFSLLVPRVSPSSPYPQKTPDNLLPRFCNQSLMSDFKSFFYCLFACCERLRIRLHIGGSSLNRIKIDNFF